ncbi:unnamed protein product [Blepharisma stoltei]|uniref:Uncharacterized protein n=1 Tax=Blepharisma stoltei TaxID=1481888 RepID=A0AAU9JVU6_9CILI|nr:unnamed protein product [Blepharisma stoltei]
MLTLLNLSKDSADAIKSFLFVDEAHYPLDSEKWLIESKEFKTFSIEESKIEELFKGLSSFPSDLNCNSSSNCLQFQTLNIQNFHNPIIFEFSQNFIRGWKRNLLDLPKTIENFCPGGLIWNFSNKENNQETISCRKYSISSQLNEINFIQKIGEVIYIGGGGGGFSYTIKTQDSHTSALIWNILPKNSDSFFKSYHKFENSKCLQKFRRICSFIPKTA